MRVVTALILKGKHNIKPIGADIAGVVDMLTPR